MRLTIGHLYPDLFNLYGDGGNVLCLQKRLAWRGIEAQVVPVAAGERIDFSGLDIICWGGAPDRGQERAAGYLAEIRQDFKAYVEDGGVVLAVCAAYQLLGRYYRTEKKTVEGLGILDICTEWKPGRLVGNIVLESPLFKSPVVGFENHAGRTDTGEYAPFGSVLYGHGNTDRGGYEGLVYKNVIGTYLHGPLLPKNPEVCDWLLERALKRRFGRAVSLAPLPDAQEHRANRQIVERFTDSGERNFGDSTASGVDKIRECAIVLNAKKRV